MVLTDRTRRVRLDLSRVCVVDVDGMMAIVTAFIVGVATGVIALFAIWVWMEISDFFRSQQ